MKILFTFYGISDWKTSRYTVFGVHNAEAYVETMSVFLHRNSTETDIIINSKWSWLSHVNRDKFFHQILCKCYL